jgi:hypothetical protein
MITENEIAAKEAAFAASLKGVDGKPIELKPLTEVSQAVQITEGLGAPTVDCEFTGLGRTVPETISANNRHISGFDALVFESANGKLHYVSRSLFTRTHFKMQAGVKPIMLGETFPSVENRLGGALPANLLEIPKGAILHFNGIIPGFDERFDENRQRTGEYALRQVRTYSLSAPVA